MDRMELAAFLRAARHRLRPADVGLSVDGSRRRTPGLRREEVAELSGVGLTWYTRLEQGRAAAASAQVVDALALAFGLDADQHRHLRTLAGLPARPDPAATGHAAGGVSARLQHLVDAASPNPASVYDGHFDFLAWNAPYVKVRHDPAAMPPGRRNLLWFLFTHEQNRNRMARWEPAARAVLGQFRAAVGRRPRDPRFAELVAALRQASPQFRQWWSEYPVREFRPVTLQLDHPRAGRLGLDLFQLRPLEHPDLLLVVQVPATADDQRRIRLLLDDD